MSSKNKKLNLDKDCLYNLYINQKMTSKEIAEIFKCTSKSIRNYLKAFDIPVRPNGEAVKLERSKWSQNKEDARSKAFIQNWNNKSEEDKLQITKKRTKNINSPEAIHKAKITKFNNNTFKKSQAEDDFYNKLKLFIDENEIIRGYTDNRYPFNCDFYIKSKDLFIEFQGHQTHGSIPYDELNPKCWNEVEYLENHGFGAITYTVRDPRKIEIAKTNKIKLLLIYPKNNSYLIQNGTMSNIGKFDLTKINELC